VEGITIRQITVTTLAARNILQTAIEAGSYGCGAWASRIFDVKRDGDRRIVSAVIEWPEGDAGRTKGNRAKITDAEIKWAVQRTLQKPEEVGIKSSKQLGRIIVGEFDGPLAEAIVQVACFGKVIYG
jgi:hypothetical protein